MAISTYLGEYSYEREAYINQQNAMAHMRQLASLGQARSQGIGQGYGYLTGSGTNATTTITSDCTTGTFSTVTAGDIIRIARTTGVDPDEVMRERAPKYSDRPPVIAFLRKRVDPWLPSMASLRC